MKQDRPLSYSSLKQFDVSPNHLISYWNRDLTSSSAQVKGTLIHTLTLEPDTFEEKYAIFEGKVKRGKAYDEFVLENEGKMIISNSDFLEASQVKAAVWENEAVRLLFDMTNTTEELVEWTSNGISLKGFIDGIGDDFIFDLKTTQSSDPKRFASDAFKYGYAMQAAMYCEAKSIKNFYIIAVESKAPFNVTLFKMTDEMLAYGKDQFDRISENYKSWDGKPVGYSDIVEPLGLPAWFKREEEQVDRF